MGHKNKDAAVQPEASFAAYDEYSHVSGSIQTTPEYYSDGAIIVHVNIDVVTMQSGSQEEYLILCIQKYPRTMGYLKKRV